MIVAERLMQIYMMLKDAIGPEEEAPSISYSNHVTSQGLHFKFSSKAGKMEMAQLVKCLSDEHKGPSSSLQHPCRSWEERETDRSWEPSGRESQVQREILS